jgi:hypothetical protein
LLEHHRLRLEATSAALGPAARTGYEVSLDLFGDRPEPVQKRFAVAEALSHLERLVAEGRAARTGDGRAISYTGR